MKRFMACVALLALACSARAGDIEVQVGYADDLRASPFFPFPWAPAGANGVQVFAGSGSPFDSGAVRIINNGLVPHTITALTVDTFGDGASFSIWGGSLPIILLPGNSAIFTQTAQFNFDSSDDGGGLNGGLAATPHVKVTVDAVMSDLVDTAQVLNTEGSDHLPPLNESHAWRDIGTFGGQAGVPEPASLTLLGIGIAGMAGYGWRRKKQQASAC